MEEHKITIKDAKVTKDVAYQKAQAELGQDIKSFFAERDKTNRGIDGKMEDMEKISEAEAEVKELLYKDSLKDKEIPSTITPMFNQLFVTARRNKIKTESGLYLPQATFGTISETDTEIDYQAIQKVMATGPQTQQVVSGMEVVINFESFRRRLDQTMAQRMRKDSVIEVPTVTIDGTEYLRISERDLEYIHDNKGLVKE